MAPALMAPATEASSSTLVSATTSTSGISRRISLVASMPSITGISRSISTTSGTRRRAMATASSPLPASPTTWRAGSSSRNPRSPRRTTLWSSVIKTRIVTASCPPLNL
jgi:hypothetical protein